MKMWTSYMKKQCIELATAATNFEKEEEKKKKTKTKTSKTNKTKKKPKNSNVGEITFQIQINSCYAYEIW